MPVLSYTRSHQRSCEIKKRNLAEQAMRNDGGSSSGAMRNDGGSSSGTGPTVIIQNTQSSITEAMRMFTKKDNLSVGKNTQSRKGNDHNVVNSTQESHVTGTSRPSKLQFTKGAGKKNVGCMQDPFVEDVNGTKKYKKPCRV